MSSDIYIWLIFSDGGKRKIYVSAPLIGEHIRDGGKLFLVENITKYSEEKEGQFIWDVFVREVEEEHV